MHALIQPSEYSHAFLIVSLFLYGLLAGSFLNVVIYRLPIMIERQWIIESGVAPAEQASKVFNLALPRSHCPHCDHPIAWHQNIPLISYVLLRGRCGNCQSPISLRYPLVELLTATLYLAAGLTFGLEWSLLFYLVFISFLVALAMIDIDCQFLFDVMTLPLLWIGLLISAVHPALGFVDAKGSIFGAAIGYLLFWGISQYYELVHKKTGLGGGDAKLIAALGAWFGAEALLFQIIPIASAVALIWCACMIFFFGAKKNAHFPFGPAICISGGLTLFFGYFLGPIFKNIL